MIALAGLTVTAFGGLGWLGSLTWHGGRQAQKLDNAIKDIAEIERTQTVHSTAIAGWAHVAAVVEEVRTDVKGLLTRNARRDSRGGD